MQRRIFELALAVLMLAVSPSLLAQATQKPRPAQPIPDLSGIWSWIDGKGFGFLGKGEEPPMLPWAEEKYRTVRSTATNEPAKAGNELNPDLYPYCLPHGFPRIYDTPHPFEIVQMPGRVYMNFEIGNQMRRIYTDGSKHHEGWPAQYMGDSIGHYEGDTLVVETVNLNPLNWIDALGHPHSDALRVEERIRRVNHDTLEINFLFDDPKTYSKPWRGKRIYPLRQGWDVLENIVCEEESGAAYREAYRKAGGGKSEVPK